MYTISRTLASYANGSSHSAYTHTVQHKITTRTKLTRIVRKKRERLHFSNCFSCFTFNIAHFFVSFLFAIRSLSSAPFVLLDNSFFFCIFVNCVHCKFNRHITLNHFENRSVNLKKTKMNIFFVSHENPRKVHKKWRFSILFSFQLLSVRFERLKLTCERVIRMINGQNTSVRESDEK